MSEHATLLLSLAKPRRLLGRLRSGWAASAVLLTVGVGFTLAGGVETAKVSQPATIELKLDSNLPAYDIAWSDHTSEACQTLADQAVAEMADPATPFVLKIADLPVVWRPLPASFSGATVRASASATHSRRAARRRAPRVLSNNSLSDMTGAPIDRAKLNSGRIHYERDIETALLDIVARIRAQRPGAMLSIENFVSPQSSGASASAYQNLHSSLDFVVLDMPKVVQVNHGVGELNRRSRARAMMESKGIDFQNALRMANPPDGMWVAIGNDGEWTAVDDEPLPTEVTDAADQNPTDWTDGADSPSEPDSSSPSVGTDAQSNGASSGSSNSTPPVFTDSNNNTNNTPDAPTADDGPDNPVDQSFGTDSDGSNDADSGAADTGDDSSADDGGGSDDDASADADTGSDDDSAGDDSGSDDDSAGDDSGGGQTSSGGGQTTSSGSGSTNTGTPGVGPIVVPGSGFTSVTPFPGPVGTGAGSDAKAIARWDVVPHQTFTGQFTIGVVAFHVNGIDRVEFSANGGPWTPVYQMQLNPRTNVWEYFATLDASDFTDGAVEVRAVVYPVTGVPRVLAGDLTNNTNISLGEYSMFLNANSNGSLVSAQRWVDAMGGSDTAGDGSMLNPFKTLWRASESIYLAGGGANPGNGATIYCNKGVYEWYRPSGTHMAATSDRWLTVQPAAGVLGTKVLIVKAQGPAGQGLNTQFAHFKNITLTGQPLSLAVSTNKDRFLWIDNSTLRDGGLFWTLGWYDGLYVTDTLATNMTEHAILGADLARNDIVDNFGGDGFKAGRLVVNCELRNQVGPENSLHSDIWQEATGYKDNIILYGVVAKVGMYEQGVFSRTDHHSDFAIVNCEFRMGGYPSQSQWKTRTDHMLVMYNTFLGEPFQIALSDNHPDVVSGYAESTNAAWRNNIFQWLNLSDVGAVSGSTTPTYADLGPGIVLESNHFIDIWPAYTTHAGQAIGKPFGVNATEGVTAPVGVGAYGIAPPPWLP